MDITAFTMILLLLYPQNFIVISSPGSRIFLYSLSVIYICGDVGRDQLNTCVYNACPPDIYTFIQMKLNFKTFM